MVGHWLHKHEVLGSIPCAGITFCLQMLQNLTKIVVTGDQLFNFQLYLSVSHFKIQVPFLKSYFLLLLGQYFQNLGVHFNPETGDNHIILLADQNSAHIAHTSQMFKITQYFSYLK